MLFEMVFFVVWFDGMEYFVWLINLVELIYFGCFDFLVIGVFVVMKDGIWFGKGYIYFDFEWGMFIDFGFVDEVMLVVMVVYDV